jgi:hypothetical protein
MSPAPEAQASSVESRAAAEQATISGREQRVLGIIETARSKRAKFRDAQINMAHGAGGKATQSLIEGLLVPAFASSTLAEMADAGALTIDGVELALSTDSYVVRPLRFPGGSIGELAVNGTVNDLAVSGAEPLALSLSLVLEEGLGADELRAEVEAIAAAARAAGVAVITGDSWARGAPARRPDPAFRQHRRARHRDHARARRVRARRADRVRHVLAVAGG